METLLLHPKLVHLPIALAILMPMVTAGMVLAWWRQWLPPRAWVVAVLLQAALLGSGLLALTTGEVDEEQVERFVPEAALEQHEEAAEAFVWGSGAVLGVMLLALAVARKRIGLPVAGMATLGTVAVLGLGYRTGEAGGALVYEHGAANAYVTAGSGAPVAGKVDDDDD